MAPRGEQLVGRAAELGSLDGALAELGRRRPGAIELVGEPGIGKTRLLVELGALADERGHTVLSGSASEFERDLPFWVFVDALDEFVAGLEPRALGSLDDAVKADAGRVFPALAANGGQPTAGGPGQDERYRIHRAVRRLLEALAARKPLVLLLDDLHWADAASIELLAALLRRPPAAPVLTAIALRPRQVPGRLSSALERAVRDGALTTVELAALSADEARELLGPAPDATALIEESGGNPFYLQQLARAGDGHGTPVSALAVPALGAIGVPRAVAAALAEELADLPDGPRRVLQGAAVAGDPFEPELAAAAAGMAEAETVVHLDEVFARDLVRTTGVPRRFRFRHPLVRRAVLEATPGGWLLGAHERAADALSERGAPAEARAHHVEHAGRHGDAAAIAVLVEAGQRVAKRSPPSAARWFAAALRLLPDGAPAPERGRLLAGLAAAQAESGRFLEARATVLDALALVPAGDLPTRVAMITTCAGLEHLVGRHDEAHARLLALIEELPAIPTREAAELMLEMALDGIFRRDYEQMREWAARALDVAREVDDRTLAAAAATNHALALAFLCRVGEAEIARTEAAALAEALTDDEVVARPMAIANLAGAEFYLDRLEDATAHGERALAVGRAAGHGPVFALLNPVVGNNRLARGRLAEAAELFDEAIELSRVSGNDQLLAWNLVNRSLTATAAGDTATALASAEEMAALPGALEEGLPSAWAGIALGSALLGAGDPARAVEVLVSAAGGDDLPYIPGVFRATGLELLTRCLLAAGRRDDAARAAAHAQAFAEDVGLPTAVAMADRAAAAVALEAGDAATAAERALASAAVATANGNTVEAALARVLAGRALAANGDSAAAGEQIARAAADLEACGAIARRDAAERELRRIGHRRPHRRTRAGAGDGAGVAALTARELEVARLVVDRRTNPEIAAVLFLSPKTVETHMRNLFHKLGVASRVEVARVVEKAERETAGR